MAAPFALGPLGRLCRGALVVALLTAVCAAGPASASGGAAGSDARSGTRPSVVPPRCAFADAYGRHRAAAPPRQAGYAVVPPAGPLRPLAEDSTSISGLPQSVPGPVLPAGHSHGRPVPSRSADGSGGPVPYPLPVLVHRLCAADLPAVAAQRPLSSRVLTARPAAKPVQAATGTKPLVFMGFGTMAGLTLLAGAGLVSSARRRRGSGPPADRC
ncbi:hypothetical protein Scani_21950 [Streptomyces caniferus]|uniref:Gram-positive cocci surface proteins LPxTG domain-containing protein n=1 Tax=Streptomyces caniferus TaxID=285557 RepID=A0A640S4L8_9ACTN|nr:hypothetical protein [Streptomyces caniferus]GFE05927.1 hypothetical protein Scani_21950 [Streptomyces caniferus]